MKTKTTTDTKKHPTADQQRQKSLRSQGIAIIESVLSDRGSPIIGLYLYTAHIELMKSLQKKTGYHQIAAHLIGTPAILLMKPGLSQTQLAEFLGCERATAGLQVTDCIAKGWVRRVSCEQDRRKYRLYITAKGQRMLKTAQTLIPEHENEFSHVLSMSERLMLRKLLSKLILPK